MLRENERGVNDTVSTCTVPTAHTGWGKGCRMPKIACRSGASEDVGMCFPPHSIFVAVSWRLFLWAWHSLAHTENDSLVHSHAGIPLQEAQLHWKEWHWGLGVIRACEAVCCNAVQ